MLVKPISLSPASSLSSLPPKLERPADSPNSASSASSSSPVAGSRWCFDRRRRRPENKQEAATSTAMTVALPPAAATNAAATDAQSRARLARPSSLPTGAVEGDGGAPDAALVLATGLANPACSRTRPADASTYCETSPP